MAASEFQCTVEGFRMLTPTVFELTFKADRPFSFLGGQFASVIIPGAGPGGRNLRRAYSIASPPESDPVELCVKVVEEGPGSGYLAKLRPGDVFKAVSPYGDFVFSPSPERIPVFIGTGTGIAPIRSILLSKQYADNAPTKAYCLFGVRHESELLYVNDLCDLATVEWIPTVSQPGANWTGFRGRVTDYLRTLNDDFPWKTADFYICGNGPMIQETKSILEEKGVEKSAIHQEKYY